MGAKEITARLAAMIVAAELADQLTSAMFNKDNYNLTTVVPFSSEVVPMVSEVTPPWWASWRAGGEWGRPLKGKKDER